jgi:GTP-binding protein
MFIDEITLHLKAGAGGNGVVRWLHEKSKEYGGPSGGNGGRGGDVYLVPVRNVVLLARYRAEKSFEAGKGEDGKSRGMDGAGGKDLVLELPLGSIVTNKETHRSYELLEEGKPIRVLEGGAGGKGNKHFKSSINTRPKERTMGKRGDEADFHIELQLIADAGIIGLPNAGKTSLLNVLTKSRGKVADYPFTTLEPNLGNFFGYILADIPGLIEGASEGKGLGDKFLRHVRRTKVLIHCISLESENVADVYKMIRQELGAHNKTLLGKEEIIVLTKTDLVDAETIKRAEKSLKEYKRKIFKISILDDKSIKIFSDGLAKILRAA